MATALTTITLLRSSPEAASSSAAVSGQRLRVRLWHKRKDRSASERWPIPTNPFHRLWSDAKAADSPRISWAIEHSNGQLIGRISIREITEWDARLGIYLIEPYCGKGYGTEAMLLFGRVFFGQLLFQFLKLDVAAANLPARRMYHQLGFRDVGREWRAISHHPALALLALPAYQTHAAHYRQVGQQWEARFCEYEISRYEWPVQFEQAHYAEA